MKYGNIPIIHQKNLIKNFNIQNRGSTNDQTKALIEKTEVPQTIYTDVSMDHRKDTTKKIEIHIIVIDVSAFETISWMKMKLEFHVCFLATYLKQNPFNQI